MKTGGLSLDQATAENIPLRFFISAPIFGILAGLMVLLKGNLLFSNTRMPETVALTHLLTLGWMGSVMLGALYQMIPLLVGGIVPFPRLSRVLHTILIPAILLIVSGFFWNHLWMLKASLALLFPTILLFLLQLVQPLPGRRKPSCSACNAVCWDLSGLDPSAGFPEFGPVFRVVAGLPGSQPFENHPFADGPSGMDRFSNLRGRISCHPNVLPLKTFFG